MKFNVTFRSAFPVDFAKHPVGEEVAKYLAAKFCEHGIVFSHIDNLEDFAWSLDSKGRTPSPWLHVGAVGEERDEYQWLIQIISGVTWIGRRFGRSDVLLRNETAEKLHSILSGDSYFTDIQWHQGEYGKGEWSPTPV